MTEKELNNLLWRAFLLGARVVSAKEGSDIPLEEIGRIARIVKEIAENESTLEDPGELAAKFPDSAALFQRLATFNIRNNRELAQRIYDGFIIATT